VFVRDKNKATFVANSNSNSSAFTSWKKR
jgi:hypothetical protein